MTKLKKITLSNIRRFKENVSIDISEGATILLAPNGTGKTSVFEAIELALTGKIKRLGDPPKPVIRHNVSEAKIRLDFNDNKACEVEFVKTRKVKTIQEYPELFTKCTKEDLPFLLRLTHILDQSSRNWLVQQNAEGAAYQLDKLAIGQDASLVNSKIIGLKGALRKNIERTESQFRIVESEILAWAQLLKDRDNLKDQLPVKFEQKEDLVGALLKKHDIKGINTNSDISIIKTVIDQIQNKLQQEKSNTETRLLKLKDLSGLVNSYASSYQAYQFNSQDLLNLNNELKVTQDEKSKLQTEISELETRSIGIVEELKICQANIDLLLAHQQNETELNSIVQNLDLLSEKGNALASEKKSLDERLTEKQEIHNVYKLYLAKLQKLTETRVLLSQKKADLSLWNNLAEQRTFIERDNQDLLNKVKVSDNAVVEATNAFNIAETNLKNAEFVFQSTQQAVDGLKSAVLSISIHLPKDATECPVCSTEFKAYELHNRISANISNLETNVLPAKNNLEDCSKALVAAREFKSTKVNEFENWANRQKQTQKQLESTVKSMDDLLNKLSAANIIDAENQLIAEEKNIDAEANNLESEANSFLNIPSIEEIESNLNNIKDIRTKIEENEQQVNGFKLKQSQLAVAQDIQRQRIKEWDIATLTQTIEKLNQNIELLAIQRKTLQKQKMTKDKELASKENLISVRNQTIRQQAENLNHVKNVWLQDGFENEPNLELLQNTITSINSTLEKNEAQFMELNSISAGLSNLESVERHSRVEKEIVNKINGMDEASYAQNLTIRFERERDKLNSAKKKGEAINVFSQNLTSEIDTMNSHLKSINPYWQKILQRLIVDPKFVGTSLNPYQFRRKNKVGVNVQLNDEAFNVTEVASEAQITDLQLSFLLSMAQLYQWSPWKALLLDDPTQHHDLVHASAIFDLLRDYIVDYGFQIIVATHDTVQANYFLRKLRNDGIKANIYNLRATEFGVDAIPG
ncbi:MAG: chromosome segregation protein [Bacteroidota bacterium]|nr:chromosome segregation protein [Bacteroidota bacterium]